MTLGRSGGSGGDERRLHPDPTVPKIAPPAASYETGRRVFFVNV